MNNILLSPGGAIRNCDGGTYKITVISMCGIFNIAFMLKDMITDKLHCILLFTAIEIASKPRHVIFIELRCIHDDKQKS